MDRVAVFVDAGHVYAGGSAALTGAAKKRTEMTLSAPVLATLLEERAKSISGLPLLRIYWYDGLVNGRHSTDQQILASTDNIKLRLGIVNSVGEQKGVDARIVTDLADLARNCAICDAILIGGDEDLRIGVELAQERGVRVHLLSIESTNVSQTLREAADTTSQITKAEVGQFLTINLAAPVPAPKAVTAAAVPAKASAKYDTALAHAFKGVSIETNVAATVAASVDYSKVVGEYLGTLSPAEAGALKTAMQAVAGSVPRDHDGRLLGRARDTVGRTLVREEIKKLRQEVRLQVEAQPTA
ncbi:NYN domain-containing protein [Paraburkholderia sp. UCT31]|uniref:NYN domain-containing protein n=1 Tax=Paraburkholderia sp. UCT31 TaxID=2615209 RepID=UPI001655FD8B|nr:NYN domain-containing protein [Paraburkholderia sp. UCT31]MBC8739462.1 NYN domain-containing protein [Paraburkholderia sp. UCT31]